MTTRGIGEPFKPFMVTCSKCGVSKRVDSTHDLVNWSWRKESVTKGGCTRTTHITRCPDHPKKGAARTP